MSPVPPLPSFWEFEAPAEWRSIDFISDLHLCPEMPRTFEAWRAHLLHTEADAVFILGDLFDVWIGDDARSGEFERACVDVMAEAAARRGLGLMVGNRDFLMGRALLAEAGAVALADPAVLIAFGRRTMLSHGDALCLGDIEYQRFRAQVRNEAWQRGFLAQPLDLRRQQARKLRDASEARKSRSAPVDWVDIDSATAVHWMHSAGSDTLIHGHTHQPGSEPMAPGYVRHVLSDWDLDDAARPRAEVLRYDAQGFHRLVPAHAAALQRA